MRMLICAAAMLGISLGSGCMHEKPNSDRDLIVTTATGLNGKVALVRVDARFVVLSFPVGQMPVVGQRLNVYRNGLKVGELNVTGPQNDDNTIADITAGEAAKGDEVRDR